jgi:hypothetical protein
MNLLDYLTPLIGQPQPAGPLTEASYAQLPFHLLAEGQAPFAAWHRPDSPVPAELQPLWRRAAAGHQLCAFHAVNAVTLGNPFAERILAHQMTFLDGLRPGLGVQHAAEIRRLYDFASHPLQVKAENGSLVEVPTDWRIAVDFLLSSEESPFRTEGTGFSVEGAPAFPDERDEVLAYDLEHAWSAAADAFAALLGTLRTD